MARERRDLPKAEIEVTPEMIEAGYSVANAVGPLAVVCEQDWLERAYRAMRRLEGRLPEGS